MKNRVTLSGAEFKDLAAKMTRFPGLGMFGGSDLVHLSADGEWFKASATGVVLAVGRRRCTEKLSLCAIDVRVLTNFAGITPESGTVKIEVLNKKELRLRCGRNEVLSPMIDSSQEFPPIDVAGVPKLKLTQEAAERIRYLADIAFNDVTRPELCCVMLGKTGNAYAMDQKAVAVLHTDLKPGVSIPLPLPFARAVEAGNVLYVDSKTTVLKAGWVYYSMPALVAAKKYPFAQILGLRQAGTDPMAEFKGEQLAGAIDDCVRCLGQLARTETQATVRLAEGIAYVGGENSGTTFETSIKAEVSTLGVFRVPLASLSRVRPFLRGTVRVLNSKAGDLYLDMKGGWCMFPSLPGDAK